MTVSSRSKLALVLIPLILAGCGIGASIVAVDSTNPFKPEAADNGGLPAPRPAAGRPALVKASRTARDAGRSDAFLRVDTDPTTRAVYTPTSSDL